MARFSSPIVSKENSKLQPLKRKRHLSGRRVTVFSCKASVSSVWTQGPTVYPAFPDILLPVPRSLKAPCSFSTSLLFLRLPPIPSSYCFSLYPSILFLHSLLSFILLPLSLLFLLFAFSFLSSFFFLPFALYFFFLFRCLSFSFSSFLLLLVSCNSLPVLRPLPSTPRRGKLAQEEKLNALGSQKQWQMPLLSSWLLPADILRPPGHLQDYPGSEPARSCACSTRPQPYALELWVPSAS